MLPDGALCQPDRRQRLRFRGQALGASSRTIRRNDSTCMAPAGSGPGRSRRPGRRREALIAGHRGGRRALFLPGDAGASRSATRALAVRIEIDQHRGDAPAPFGFGLHPWFERDAGRRAGSSRRRRFYLEEPEGVVRRPVDACRPSSISPTAGLCRSGWRNNDYGGWGGEADIRYPTRGAGLRIVADPVFRHLMLYADPTKPYFCVEPQTNASGAFNRGRWDDPEEGVIVLAPGESAAGTVAFRPFALDDLKQPRKQAAIHLHGAAGDEGGVVRDQEADGGGDLARLGDAGDAGSARRRGRAPRRRRRPRARPASSGWRPSRRARAFTRMRSTA